jgi:hypothetical protein
MPEPGFQLRDWLGGSEEWPLETPRSVRAACVLALARHSAARERAAEGRPDVTPL